MLSMELQLGLGLPIHSPMVKGLDLNYSLFRLDQSDCEVGDWDEGKCGHAKSKRTFEEAFGRINGADDLLVWHGQPNDQRDDDGKGHKNKDSCPINKVDGDEENYIIGWPPIKSSRKKELLQRQGTAWRARGNVHPAVEIRTRSTAKIKANGSSSSNNSVYVKVKMEGVAIARKVDLSLHRSYHTLKHTLLSMFSNYNEECIEDSERYTVTYQDKEGDWLLVGDVPWKSFIKSVQRLEIVRN